MKIQYLLIIALLYGCSENKAPDTAAEVQSLPVIQIHSGAATTNQEYSASVEGAVNIEIRPQVSGTLDRIFVDDGAYVHKGQTLFEINQAPFREQLNKARASLHAAQGALSNAQLEIDRLSPLVQNKVISDYQLRSALSARETARGNVEQARAEIGAAGINLGYASIKAPVSGYIGRLLRKQGSLVGPSDPTALTELSDVHELHVFFALGEYDFIRFKTQFPGRTLADKLKALPPVELILADDSTYAVKGHIDAVNGQFDRNTGAITLRATFKNPDGLLRSGNTGKVRLALRFGSQLIVPQSATLEMQDQTFVYLVDAHNKVTRQIISIAGKSGTNYLVKDGLKSGDRIVFKGFDHLHEGDQIKPQPVSPDLSHSIAKN